VSFELAGPDQLVHMVKGQVFVSGNVGDWGGPSPAISTTSSSAGWPTCKRPSTSRASSARGPAHAQRRFLQQPTQFNGPGKMPACTHELI
jgi:hypothetical protein